MSDTEKECIISIKQTSAATRTDNKEDDCETTNINNDTPTSPANMSIEDKSDNTSPTTSYMSNPFEILRKLEVVKEIKDKTINLQRMKSKLTSEIELIENGDKSLNEFKSELDLLYQERVSLLDELRNVDSDIATLEKTIKQSEEEKRRAIESTKRLKLDYRPLKEQIGHLIESIGLSSSDDAEDDALIENYLSKIGSDDTPNTTPPKYSLGIDRLLNDKPKSESNNNKYNNNNNEEPMSAFTSAIKSSNTLINHPFFLSQMDLPVQLATAALMAHTLRNNRPPSPAQMQHVPLQQSVQFNPFQSHQSHQQQQFNHFILNQMNSNSNTSAISEVAQSDSQIQLQPPQFRQQPPPMKACLSCNQQIHRNAPICPLCKAKSRSRNPKKPKKSTKSNSPDSLSPDHKQASVKRSLTDA